MNYKYLLEYANDVYDKALQYMYINRIPSLWNREGLSLGWQELWEKAPYSGLYATCSGARLLSSDKAKYNEIIFEIVKDLKTAFDKSITYPEDYNDSQMEKNRKEKCKCMLKQNCNTTLKAAYLLNLYIALLEKQFINCVECLNSITDELINQIKNAYSKEQSMFFATTDNDDISLLTTMETISVLCRMDEFNTLDLVRSTIEKFTEILRTIDFKNDFSKDKFTKYNEKKEAVISLFILSRTINFLSNEEKSLLKEKFLMAMKDNTIRCGFWIKEQIKVPDSVFAFDTYSINSKSIFLLTALSLLENKVIPIAYLEFFLDEIIEILDTINENGHYLECDKFSSFSQNVRALDIVNALISCLNECNNTIDLSKISYMEVHPTAFPQIPYRFINEKRAVIFMPFYRKWTKSFQTSVKQVFDEKYRYSFWCAQLDAYDNVVVNSIWDELIHADFVIVECTEASANVYYEAGLAMGLGKKVFLCAHNEEYFPIGGNIDTFKCVYSIDCFPYKSLQNSLREFLSDHAKEYHDEL